jgi:hypothetical protein
MIAASPSEMPQVADNLTDLQRSLLAALDSTEWRSVGHRMEPFRPWMADELVRLGLVEWRPQPRKEGAREYRRLGDAAD